MQSKQLWSRLGVLTLEISYFFHQSNNLVKCPNLENVFLSLRIFFSFTFAITSAILGLLCNKYKLFQLFRVNWLNFFGHSLKIKVSGPELQVGFGLRKISGLIRA